MILEKGQTLETEQMFREAGKSWPVIIPKEELSHPAPGVKVCFFSLYRFCLLEIMFGAFLSMLILCLLFHCGSFSVTFWMVIAAALSSLLLEFRIVWKRKTAFTFIWDSNFDFQT
ncbi:hypothetical protein Ahy_B01g053362 isoform A [Arachis hypogaea]|uniref:Uncharacterized protein n=1 Tax=Arachis hypogaea TaxID=3818 RepID=A0A445ARL3_ARAHY|nr:hypothetical protein Ahy_B01g053362 isoform A [Arachis hypogaea]